MGINYQAESWMAWIRHQPDRKRNLRVVVQALVDSPSGLTCDEIEMKSGLSHQTCSRSGRESSGRGTPADRLEPEGWLA